MTCVLGGVHARMARRLSRIAARSISATVGRYIVIVSSSFGYLIFQPDAIVPMLRSTSRTLGRRSRPGILSPSWGGKHDDDTRDRIRTLWWRSPQRVMGSRQPAERRCGLSLIHI